MPRVMSSTACSAEPAASDGLAAAAAVPSATATLIIGYGSPIRGDDALGPIVADRLQAHDLPEHITVIARHILTPDLIPAILAAEQIILIDAQIDGEPGAVYQHSLAPDPALASAMGHFLDPRELLTWVQQLYGHTPVVTLLSSPAVSFEYAYNTLTPSAEAAARAIERRVLWLVG